MQPAFKEPGRLLLGFVSLGPLPYFVISTRGALLRLWSRCQIWGGTGENLQAGGRSDRPSERSSSYNFIRSSNFWNAGSVRRGSSEGSTRAYTIEVE